MKKYRFKTQALALMTCLTLGLSGCGSSAYAPAASGSGQNTSDSGSQTTAAQTDTGTATSGAEGSDLQIMVETPVQSLDPQLGTDGTSLEVVACFTDGLTQPDKDGKTINALAESYEESDDGLTWTFHLRDAKWSNGDPVTAHDFVFAWQRAVDPNVGAEYAYMLSDIGQIKNAAAIIAGEKDKSELGVTAVDDKTLKVELETPVSYFLSLMYFPTFYPVNEKFFNTCPTTYCTSPETTLSNGAFIVDQYEPATTNFHLKKNPAYYDADRVHLSGLSYHVIQDSQTALMNYQNGTLDMTLLNGDQVDQVKEDPEFFSYGAGYLWYVTPNVGKTKELQNLNIRKALTFAINREALTEQVLKDGSIPTYTMVPLELAAGPDGTDFSGDQTMFKDVCASDAEKAAEFWKQGLQELGTDHMTLELILDADDAPQKVATVLQQQWQEALPGLTVNLKVEPKKQRLQDMEHGEFELGLTRWGPDYADPMTYLGMWVKGNTYNYGDWENTEYTKLLEDCTSGPAASKPEERWQKLLAAEKILMDDASQFPLYTQCNATMVSSRVKGVAYHAVALNRVYKDAVKN